MVCIDKYRWHIGKYWLNIGLAMYVSVKYWLGIVQILVMINLEKSVGKDRLEIG